MSKTKENEIKKLLQNNVKARQAFDMVLNYYTVYDKMHCTSHVKLITAIYIENQYKYAWQLPAIANACNSSTCEYRKEYIRCFYLCFE